MQYPADLRYTKEHEWVRVEGQKGTVGITDYAQSELGDIVFVETPEVGRALKRHESLGVVESVKTVSDIYAPVGGKVLKVNTDLEAEPERVNQSPFDKGWILELSIENPGEMETLLTAEEYRKYVEEEAVE